MSGRRAPDQHDNCQGWGDVKHFDQASSSMADPKGKGKGVTASVFTQPGTPSDEKRRESDMEWRLDGERQIVTIGNAVAKPNRSAAGIASEDFAKRG